MLKKDLTHDEMSRMYNRVCTLVILNQRNDRRFHMLMSYTNDLRKAAGQEPIDLEEFDKDMGFDQRGINEKLATEHFDLDLGDT